MKSYNHYLKTLGQSDQTRSRNIKLVKSFLLWKEVEAKESTLVYETGLSYLGHLRLRKISEGTLQNYISYLRHYGNHLVQIKVLATNPFKYLKLRKRQSSLRSDNLLLDILSKEELEKIYELYTLNSRLSLRNKILLGLYVFQGIAAGEELKISVENVNLQMAKITVPGNRRYQERALNLSAVQILLLQNYLATHQESENLISYKNRSHGVNVRGNLVHQIKVELSRAGLSYRLKNLAQIRRSVIVSWLKTYALREVQYMAGHYHVSSTESYRRGNLADLQQALEQYHPLK